MFHHINRDKRGICLNLKTPRGREILLELAGHCQIVLENFRAGVMDRLGLGYDTLSANHSDIIFAAVSSAGQSGPLADMKGYAPVISSLAGMDYMVGYADEPPVGSMNFGLCDPNAGAQAVFAVLAAVYHRERTGEGQYIDMSQLEACMALLGEAIVDLQFNGRVAEPTQNAHPARCPHGIYPCADADGWVALAMEHDADWQQLCELIGRGDWIGERQLAGHRGRLAAAAQIDAAIEKWCRTQTGGQAVSALNRIGIAAQMVLPVEKTHESLPQFTERKLMEQVQIPHLGEYPIYAFPWGWNGSRPGISHAAPQLGQHTDEVLRELLGLTDDELDRLRADKVI